MARSTKTTYTCDSCGSTVERPRDLRRYEVHDLGPGGRQYQDDARTELCEECTPKFIEALGEYFLVDALEPVAGHPDD